MANDLRRRQGDREPGLDRDDLFLLMESYRNTIELNTQLLERQEVLNGALERILTQAETLARNQAAITERIKALPDAMIDIVGPVKTSVEGHRQACLKEHADHTLKLYGTFTLLAAIIASLIGLIAKLWPSIP